MPNHSDPAIITESNVKACWTRRIPGQRPAFPAQLPSPIGRERGIGAVQWSPLKDTWPATGPPWGYHWLGASLSSCEARREPRRAGADAVGRNGATKAGQHEDVCEGRPV